MEKTNNTAQSTESKKDLIHSMDESPNKSMSPSMPKTFKPSMVVVAVIVASIVLGSLTGYGISVFSKTTSGTNGEGPGSGSAYVQGEKKAGIKDEKAFPDKATGTLVEGGLDGEGSFHLERPGGESQNVYLTSSTVDLSQFLKKKVEVWGQTFTAEKAGWLMDVGYVEVK
ncbi:hypothetical protein KC726_05360 [Candidatus Woesebacteria bacterium]|nr:hypothetical protein [Candidatus Woesebacteria bacterium]